MVDLTKYTGISREGRVLKFGNRYVYSTIQNENKFPTIEEAKKFEKLYNILAIEAIKEMMSIIKEYKIVRNSKGKKFSEEELAWWAQQYYQSGGIGRGGPRGPTLDSVLDKAKELYTLSKNLAIMKRAGLMR